MKNLTLVLAAVIGSMTLSYGQATRTEQTTTNKNTTTNQTTSTPHYKDRMGFSFGNGAGFGSIPMLELTDGTTTSMSFGGGGCVQFFYGREINPHFDIELGFFGFQSSGLDREVSNASMSFSRSSLSITPSYIIPVGKKGNKRLKLGGGIDFIYNAEFDFDLHQIQGGTRDTWTYDNTIGEHVSASFEITSRNKRFSFVPEIKYSNANYKFVSGQRTYPLENSLKTPDGSGLDLILGFHYNFNWKKAKA